MKWLLTFCIWFFACSIATAQGNYPLAGQMDGGGSAPYGLAGGMGAGSAPLPATVNLVFEGDSITFGLACNAPLNYPTRAILQLPSGPAYTNDTIATSGISSITLAGSYSTRGGAAFSGSFAQNMLMYMAGTNTSGSSDTNAGQKYWYNRQYLRFARNTGYQRIALGTLIARDDDGGTFWTSTIVPLNTYQRAYYNSDMQADVLMDWGNDSPYFTPYTAALNQTYYNTDFIHPIPAGCQQLANIAAPQMTANLSSAGARVFAPTTWSPFTNSTNGFGGYDGTTTLTTDFRTAGVPTGSATYGIRGFPGFNSGKYYWEFTVTVASAVTVGLVNDYFLFNNSEFIGEGTGSNSVAYRNDGHIRINGAFLETAAVTYQTADVIGEAVDFSNKLVWFRRCRSGVCQNWNGNASANPATGAGGISISVLAIDGVGDRYYPAAGVFSSTDAVVSEFAASQLTQTAPSGFNSGFGGSISSTQAPGPSTILYASPYYFCVKNYYVSTTGSDSNTTTQAQNPSTPWLTIGRYNALATAAAGDCINVAAGTYAAGVSITKGGTTASSVGYVVYRCQTLDGCTVTDTGNQTNNSAFSVQANYVMIDGFTINGGAGTGSFTVGIKTCGNNNCSGGTASTFSNHHIWALNNIISGYGQAGVELDNGEYFYTAHNTIFNNAHDCNLGAQGSNISYYLPFAIQGGYTPTADDANNPITGSTGTHYRQFIMWNKIYNAYVCSGSTVGVTDGNGIITDDWHGDQVSSCTFTTCIYTNGGLVAGNATYNNGGGGIHIFNSEYVTVANNSVFNNYIQPGNTNQGYRGGIDDELSYGTNLINNLSYSGCGSGAEANNTAMGVFATDGYNGSSTLAAAITSTSQSSISITSAAQFPGGSTFNSNGTLNMLFSGDYSLPGGNLIKIDSEIMWVTAGWNTTTWTVTRGYNGTTAATHSNSATVTWIQSYWTNNITFATSPCTDLAIGNSPNGVFYSTTVNKEATLPGWTNVGNTSFGSQSTPPNGVNFALAGGSAAINYGSISSPFNFLPSSAIDGGSCSSSLSTCP